MKYAVQRYSAAGWSTVHRLEDAFSSWGKADRYIDNLQANGITGTYRVQPIEDGATCVRVSP